MCNTKQAINSDPLMNLCTNETVYKPQSLGTLEGDCPAVSFDRSTKRLTLLVSQSEEE